MSDRRVPATAGHGGLMAALAICGVLCLGAASVTWAADDEPTPADTETQTPASQPRPMSEIAGEIAQHEQKIDQLEEQIDQQESGRPPEIAKETMRLTKEIADAKRQLSSSGMPRIPADKQKEYRELSKEHQERLAELRKKYEDRMRELLRKANSAKERARAKEDYESSVKDENRSFKEKVLDLAGGEKPEDLKQKIKDNEEALAALRKERTELNGKIEELRSDLSKEMIPLRKLYAEAAERPQEAWDAGLRPRGGSYQIDAETGKLSTAGGQWGKPVDNKKWQRSNESQGMQLLNLAERMKADGKLDFARICWQRILDELPKAKAAEKATKLLAGDDKKPDSTDGGEGGAGAGD